jgi:diguanylate cyclase (GGDEF)-like protein
VRRILVIAADAGVRLMMTTALAKAGFQTVLAASAGEGRDTFAQQPMDMVLLDVDLPDSSGHALCAELRDIAGDLLPIVMVAGKDDVNSIEQAYNSGATDFIAKPINWALLGHRLCYLFRSYTAQSALRAAEARSAAMLSALPDTLLRFDAVGTVIETRVPEEARHANVAPATGTNLAAHYPSEIFQVLLDAARQACVSPLDQLREFSIAGAHGRLRHFEARIAKIDTSESLCLLRDITERREADARIARLAYFDSLTGLPNRAAFLDRLAREVRRAQHEQSQLGVLFMDLDDFKQINDTLGHNAGDMILLSAADRLREALRPSDFVSRGGDTLDPIEHVARLGGDEFTVLLPNLASINDALAVAHRIGATMRRPFSLDERDLRLTSSIGVAMFPDDGQDAATLLKHADTAMYHAKSSGRDNSQLYSARLTEKAIHRLDLETSLRAAISRDEFRLVYQPQVECSSGRVFAVEALIRWIHPLRGLISPLDFIPLAEENGQIEAIGAWVLRTACADAARWYQQGLDLRVAINLSPLQFRAKDLVETSMNVLREVELPPERLEIEVTESAMMENTAATIASLQAFRDQGVRLALDDFGTGFSSLSYLTRMPVQKIKVDRSFVVRMARDSESNAIVRAILAMASSLNINVIAEGVETLDQAQLLKSMECYALQGYYFSKPVPAQDIPVLLQRRWDLELLAEAA